MTYVVRELDGAAEVEFIPTAERDAIALSDTVQPGDVLCFRARVARVMIEGGYHRGFGVAPNAENYRGQRFAIVLDTQDIELTSRYPGYRAPRDPEGLKP